MSKIKGIEKRKFCSFFIYHLIAIWILSGCAANSSMDRGVSELKSPPSVAKADTWSKDEIQYLAASAEENEGAAAEQTFDKYTESTEPHMLLSPLKSDDKQIIGIDFTMFDQGKSKLIITTNREVAYDLDRVNPNKLALNINDSVIMPDLLTRKVDTSEYPSAVSSVKPVFYQDDKKVSIGISLREMVPFHIKQADNQITMEFGRAKAKGKGTEVTPINLAGAEVRSLAGSQPQSQMPMVSAGAYNTSPAPVKKTYTGAPMYLDFIDEDVTNIFRLINEISEENIIWDPSIKGQKVSMILENVPWDEALELILKNNDLAKRYVGENIIWITTKQKMAQIIAEEEAEYKKMQDKLEAERQRILEAKKMEEDDAPLITEYLPVDFAKAGEIKEHLVPSERGTISIDTRTNTIIMTDTANTIEAARKTIKQFDIPVKQIMIEARIVDATDSFSRDLGLQWNNTTSGWRQKQGSVAEFPGDATTFTVGGERVYGGSFSTNAPESWSGNVGVNFARLTSSGLGSITLDASLAIAENEGTAKIMSAPKVIAREGTSATISSGDSIIIPATENVASTTLDATLSLTVTPSAVSYNNFITLDVNVTDDQAPSTSRLLRKSINTTLMVKSGETVVIGGIIKESEGDDISGVPVLKDIPGLGWLFKAKRKTRSKSELLIFLTPTVIPSPVN